MSRREGVTTFLFLATVFTITFAKLRWAVGGDLALSDVLTFLFVVSFATDRLVRGERRVSRAAVVVAAFFALFLLVYLIGFFNLDTEQALAQWAKGMVKFVLHFLLLGCGVALLVRRGEAFYWRTLAWFCGGLVVNALYGILQLGLAETTGTDLDQSLLSPLTGGASSINIYGAIDGASVFRPNALTGDPNHLGIELLIPLLVLTPIYLRLEHGHRLRRPLAGILAFLLLVQFATLSRSGLLGLVAGLFVLAVPYRRKLVSAALLVPLGAVTAVLAAVVLTRKGFFETVLRSRVEMGGGSSSPHFLVYSFIPDVLQSNPFFGLGLNNFAVYYEFVTGKTNYGPHSFYVAQLVESGLVGSALFAAFLIYLFRRLGALRRLGRALEAAGDPISARLRPLAWGMTAALVGTMAANVFYLTIQFYYFYAFAMLVLAAPVVFGRFRQAGPSSTTPHAPSR